MNKPKLSKSGVPTIPMNEPMSWEDWLKGRRARRETGNRVAPEIIRRPTSSSDKRLRKLDSVDYGSHWADVEGEGELAVLTFGSCTAPVREAFARARKDGFNARLISMRLLSPAQPARLAAALSGVKRVLVVEQTHSGQFYRYLRSEYDLPGSVSSYRRPGPLPMRPGEIVSQLEQWSKA